MSCAQEGSNLGREHGRCVCVCERERDNATCSLRFGKLGESMMRGFHFGPRARNAAVSDWDSALFLLATVRYRAPACNLLSQLGREHMMGLLSSLSPSLLVVALCISILFLDRRESPSHVSRAASTLGEPSALR